MPRMGGVIRGEYVVGPQCLSQETKTDTFDQRDVMIATSTFVDIVSMETSTPEYVALETTLDAYVGNIAKRLSGRDEGIFNHKIKKLIRAYFGDDYDGFMCRVEICKKSSLGNVCYAAIGLLSGESLYKPDTVVNEIKKSGLFDDLKICIEYIATDSGGFARHSCLADEIRGMVAYEIDDGDDTLDWIWFDIAAYAEWLYRTFAPRRLFALKRCVNQLLEHAATLVLAPYVVDAARDVLSPNIAALIIESFGASFEAFITKVIQIPPHVGARDLITANTKDVDRQGLRLQVRRSVDYISMWSFVRDHPIKKLCLIFGPGCVHDPSWSSFVGAIGPQIREAFCSIATEYVMELFEFGV